MKKKLLGTIDQNMIDDENKKIQKTFKVIGGDIFREKKNTNKRLRWGHILGMKKWLDYIDEKQKIYMEISGDIFREIKTPTKD